MGCSTVLVLLLLLLVMVEGGGLWVRWVGEVVPRTRFGGALRV